MVYGSKDIEPRARKLTDIISRAELERMIDGFVPMKPSVEMPGYFWDGKRWVRKIGTPAHKTVSEVQMEKLKEEAQSQQRVTSKRVSTMALLALGAAGAYLFVKAQ